MDYSTNTTPQEATYSPPQPDQSAQGTPSPADVPVLDSEGSTISSSSPAAGPSSSASSAFTNFNPEAPWFDIVHPLEPDTIDPALVCANPPHVNYEGFDFFNPTGIPAPQVFGGPPLQFNAFPTGYTTNEDLKLLILTLMHRMDALERAVTFGNSKWDRAERLIAEFGARPGPEEAIDGLKKTLKEFTTTLVGQILGEDMSSGMGGQDEQ